ncbi:Asa1p NDAI_0A04980 [Naumovozyma dairenensis CBS 421]|uniref:ASTRA-associated protein 1 n=1 Tax=Naumovozyma dairenensis (strain ATCC 10597 / BCRC 20456 / CBS 421 / NBRC 0211 / NRRL Y-12639) TaxID=1071378 RepID=G0W4B5_NAUDC|nr:hypothetical protein NDAI_0A04980 [Naumovozyma dairenensis CBS 421]CCD22653.1 hypothetical protein NDAI_0A04980 [Naumovozyma dairenensis CBS 421]
MLGTKLQLPTYTLRSHTNPVTCLALIPNNRDPSLIPPNLISGDSKGQLIIWDLITRRPIYHFQECPKGQIVFIQILESATLPIVGRRNTTLIAILSKDHKLRIYSYDHMFNGSQNNIRCELRFHVPINTLNFANFTIKPMSFNDNHENECDEEEWFQLYCCNTQDSECIDVYKFKLDELHSLKRQVNALNLYPLIIDLIKIATTTTTTTTNDKTVKIKSLDKLGIIMKFVINPKNNVIYIGFESGFVIGIKVYDRLQVRRNDDSGHIQSSPNAIGKHVRTTNVNDSSGSGLSKLLKQAQPEKTQPTLSLANDQSVKTYQDIIEIVYVSSFHYPNPILDLEIKNDILLSSSTTGQLGIHNVSNLAMNNDTTLDSSEYRLSKYKDMNIIRRNNLQINNSNDNADSIDIKTTNINHIQQLNDFLLISNWKGETLVGSSSRVIKGEAFESLVNFSKVKSTVKIIDSSKGSLQNTSNEDRKEPKFCKIGCMIGISSLPAVENGNRLTSPSSLTPSSSVSLNVGQMRRITKFNNSSWCFIGYDDGSIALHELLKDKLIK